MCQYLISFFRLISYLRCSVFLDLLVFWLVSFSWHLFDLGDVKIGVFSSVVEQNHRDR